jgi:hypothetical protein
MVRRPPKTDQSKVDDEVSKPRPQHMSSLAVSFGAAVTHGYIYENKRSGPNFDSTHMPAMTNF